MTTEEFKEYKEGWIRAKAYRLKQQQVSDVVAEFTAKAEFDLLVKDNFKKVDAFVLKLRQERKGKQAFYIKAP